MKLFTSMGIGPKLYFFAVVSTLAILANAGVLLLSGKSSMLEEKKLATQGIVESAHSVVSYYHKQATTGLMSEADARKSALAALGSVRYGSQDYVWVNDMRPTILMHPMKPELDGKDASDIKDPTGNALFMRFVEIVKRNGSGFADYQWPKPGVDSPVPKVSYVKGFEPWGWVIGSGIYVDDVDAQFRANVLQALFWVGAAILSFGVIAAALARGITRRLRTAVDLSKKVAAGDLTSSELNVTSMDEIGSLLVALQDMNHSLVKVVRQVREGSDVVASASSQIAAGNEDLSQRTEEQAASLEQTAASMEELTGTVKQNSDHAKDANQLANSASEVAAKAGVMVGKVVETMGSINESAKKMHDIISVIDGIAFQTNILALNAAVEAARAGEQGRGFAVVATEVRNLAQRSASAAKEIKDLIDSSVSQVSAGSDHVAEAGKTMQEVVSSIGRVTAIMGEISAASQEQTLGIEQVGKAITQMDAVTQQNAALVEEAASAAQSMREQAGNLVEIVSVFQIGNVEAQRPATPAARKQPESAEGVAGGGFVPASAAVAA